MDQEFWDSRWQAGQTGWDIGYPSPAIVQFAEKHLSKDAKILIPGAGSGYEAQALYQMGFHQVTVLDISPTAIAKFKELCTGFPPHQTVCGDFFDHQETYDAILEQTFFCALDPKMRDAYVQHMHKLLKPGGILAGLLFQFPLTEQGPPFGGSAAEYRKRFAAYFEIQTLETCTSSILPRKGNELFFIFRRK
jgi:SAM-dependent methyltransferase